MIAPSIPQAFEFIRTHDESPDTWHLVQCRTAADRMSLGFSTLRYLDKEKEWVQHENGYLFPVYEEELKKYLVDNTTHINSLKPSWLTNTISLLKTKMTVDNIPHKAQGTPFNDVIFPDAEGRAYRNWHDMSYSESIADADVQIFIDFITKLVPDEVAREKLMAYLCYLLVESKDIQQMLILVGLPKIGKTVLTNLIGHSVATLTSNIEDVVKDRDIASNMRNKFAVIFDEIRDLNLETKAGELIKKWVCMDTLTTRGVYQKTTTLPFYARFILSCNNLPYSAYIESAFFDRICLIPCEKSYDGEAILGFDKQLIAMKDQIFSWVWDHYKDSYQTILGARSGMKREDYNMYVDSFNMFLESKLTVSDVSTPINEIYKTYADMSAEPISKVDFCRRLKKRGYESERVYHDGQRQTMYYATLAGVRL